MADDPLKRIARIGSGRTANGAAGAAYGKYAGAGLQFAATIGAFTWLGWYLDERFGSSPWLILAGVMLGFTGALISLVRKVPPARGRRPADERDTDTTSP